MTNSLLRVARVALAVAALASAGCAGGAGRFGEVKLGMTKNEVERLAGAPDAVSESASAEAKPGAPARMIRRRECWEYGLRPRPGEDGPPRYTFCFFGGRDRVGLIARNRRVD